MFEATLCGRSAGQYSRVSCSSDQVTGTGFPHLKMPFLPNSEFIENIVLVGSGNYRPSAPLLYGVKQLPFRPLLLSVLALFLGANLQ